MYLYANYLNDMAKPKIDLSNSVVLAGIEKYKQQAKLAYDLAAAKDDAVRAVYALNVRKNSVQHIGSCVLLKVSGEHFALSASHVFDDIGTYPLLFGFGDRLHSFAGDRFSSKRGPSGSHRDDPIDSSVFHITGEVPQEMESSFLTLEDLDLLAADQRPEFYVATGYRVSQSKSTSEKHTNKLDRYPSLELGHDHYERLKLTRAMHLLLAFEDQVLVNGNWQTAPSIKGFSGGAIFRIPNLSPLADATQKIDDIKLAAILIEWRKGEGDRFFSSAVGTRLGIHFGLIDKYLPELKFEEMLIAEHARQTSSLTSLQGDCS
jgi:hypothetical protein